MTHDDAAELIALDVLDTLDEGERRDLDAHLATCQACRSERESLRPVMDALLVAPPDRDPSPFLRDRVLAAARAARPPRAQPRAVRPPRSTLPAWLAAAAAVLLAVAGLLGARRASQRLEGVSAALTAARAEIAVLTAPDVIRVDLQGQPAAPRSAGRAYWSRSRGLVFSASQLPPLPPSRIYQLWFVTPGGAISAGLVQPNGSGDATLVVNTPADVTKPAAIAITVEPEGGVPAPTGAKYLVGALSQPGA